MSFNTFFEICEAFFNELNPNIYGDVEPTNYSYSDFTDYIIKILVLILGDKEKNNELNNELKNEVY
jgi:hypothetical protein